MSINNKLITSLTCVLLALQIPYAQWFPFLKHHTRMDTDRVHIDDIKDNKFSPGNLAWTLHIPPFWENEIETKKETEDEF